MATIKTINLRTHIHSKNPIRSLRTKVLECLGDSVFQIKSTQDFAYAALKCIYPINKTLKTDVTSIEKACDKLFKALPVVKGSLSVLDNNENWKEVSPDRPERQPIDIFLQTYLQFEAAPGKMLDYLQEIVKQDMSSINDLVTEYEKTDFIREHLSKSRQPKNHEERVLFDFYQRCIKEQRNITEYYLNGIKKRAIVKANYWSSGIKQMISWSEPYRDRPYHFATYLAANYFDSNKIDLIANKISDFPVDESGKIEKLYTNNKQAFYKMLLKRHKPAQIWQELHYNLLHLPLKEDRSPIFKELETLFKTKRWIGFYALALTQVEGLFSEMYLILNPMSAGTNKALSDKVEYARRFHEMSHYFFDYYQYHIPRLRNKFMHYGYDDNFKLKSFDLLFDLHHLLKMFSELKSPLVMLKNIHLKRRYEDFITYSDFAKYFQLLNDLNPHHYKEIINDIKSFEKDFLLEYCNAEYVCIEVVQELPNEIEKFLNDANPRIKSHGLTFDFEDRNHKKLETLIIQNKETAEVIADCYIFNRHESEALCSCYIFLSNHKKYLSQIPIEYSQLLTKTFEKYKTLLTNIYKIKFILPHDD